MKKTIFLTLAVLSFGVLGFAESEQNETHTKSEPVALQELTVINLREMSEQDFSEMMQGNLPHVVVEFSENTTLPLHFYLRGNLLSLMEESQDFGQAKVKQTFYARCVEGNLILSSDLSEWKPFMEFITGSSEITISIQDGEPSIVFGSETNRRI